MARFGSIAGTGLGTNDTKEPSPCFTPDSEMRQKNRPPVSLCFTPDLQYAGEEAGEGFHEAVFEAAFVEFDWTDFDAIFHVFFVMGNEVTDGACSV